MSSTHKLAVISMHNFRHTETVYIVPFTNKYVDPSASSGGLLENEDSNTFMKN
jgi:hypothetical protein